MAQTTLPNNTQLPTSIQVPTSAPMDVASMSMYMTVMMQTLQQWIAQAATILNGMEGYKFSVNTDGELVATAPNGIVTVVARPFEPQTP